MAKREKKPVHRVQMTDGKRAIIQQLLQEYEIETAEDIQDALKDLLGVNCSTPLGCVFSVPECGSNYKADTRKGVAVEYITKSA